MSVLCAEVFGNHFVIAGRDREGQSRHAFTEVKIDGARFNLSPGFVIIFRIGYDEYAVEIPTAA